jgi:hypothetical protein
MADQQCLNLPEEGRVVSTSLSQVGGAFFGVGNAGHIGEQILDGQFAAHGDLVVFSLASAVLSNSEPASIVSGRKCRTNLDHNASKSFLISFTRAFASLFVRHGKVPLSVMKSRWLVSTSLSSVTSTTSVYQGLINCAR